MSPTASSIANRTSEHKRSAGKIGSAPPELSQNKHDLAAEAEQYFSLPWLLDEPEPEPAVQVITSAERHYKAGLYAERQKFGKPKAEYQMSLAEALTDWSPEEWNLLGITPTVEEDKALSAVQILLARTDYKGNLEPDYIRSSAFRWEGQIPNLAFTPSEYLEAYGLKRDKRGRYPIHQRERAIEALLSLSRPRRILYTRTRYTEDRQKRYDVIATEQPLIALIEGYQDLTEEELRQVKAAARPERTSRIILQPSPLLIDCLETFHTYKPANLHQQIEVLVASQKGKRVRPTRSHSLFIELLHTVDLLQFKVSRERLIDILLLAKYRERRHPKDAHRQIDECLWIAQELGYILSYEEDALGVITLELNPARLSRVRARQERLQQQAERRQAKLITKAKRSQAG